MQPKLKAEAWNDGQSSPDILQRLPSRMSQFCGPNFGTGEDFVSFRGREGQQLRQDGGVGRGCRSTRVHAR